MASLFAWGEREIEGWDVPELPPGARLVIVPGADHPGVLERLDVMLPELRATLASATVGHGLTRSTPRPSPAVCPWTGTGGSSIQAGRTN